MSISAFGGLLFTEFLFHYRVFFVLRQRKDITLSHQLKIFHLYMSYFFSCIMASITLQLLFTRYEGNSSKTDCKLTSHIWTTINQTSWELKKNAQKNRLEESFRCTTKIMIKKTWQMRIKGHASSLLLDKKVWQMDDITSIQFVLFLLDSVNLQQ